MIFNLMTYVLIFVIIVIAVAATFEVWRRVCEEDDDT